MKKERLELIEEMKRVCKNDGDIYIVNHFSNESDNGLVKIFEKGLMPNLFGMNLLDAVFLLENAGLKVEINGKGLIIWGINTF